MINIPRRLIVALAIIVSQLLAACQPAPVPPPTAAPTLLPIATRMVPQRTAVPPPTARPTLVPIAVVPTLPTPVTLSPGQPARPEGLQRVLIISIDGLRPDAIEIAPMANLQTMLQTSAYSLTAKTILPSVTLPSHASMLTGLCPAQHGIDWNEYLPAKGFAKGTSLFALAHAAGLKTAMFVGKEKLRQVTPPETTDVFRFINDNDSVIAQRFSQEIPPDFGVLFIHLPTLDEVGHAFGWMSPQYLKAAIQADQAVAAIIKTLDDHALRQGTLMIITADHGGHAQTHGSDAPEDMTIPWIISGPGVHPGLISTPIQTTDTAATAAWALGLDRPQEWSGWPVFGAFGAVELPRPVPFCN